MRTEYNRDETPVNIYLRSNNTKIFFEVSFWFFYGKETSARSETEPTGGVFRQSEDVPVRTCLYTMLGNTIV